MSTRKCRCPRCQSLLGVARALPARLKCPKCGTRFTATVRGTTPPRPPWVIPAVAVGLGLFLLLGISLAVYCFTGGPSDSPAPEETAEIELPEPLPVRTAFVKQRPRLGAVPVTFVRPSAAPPGSMAAMAKSLDTREDQRRRQVGDAVRND